MIKNFYKCAFCGREWRSIEPRCTRDRCPECDRAVEPHECISIPEDGDDLKE